MSTPDPIIVSQWAYNDLVRLLTTPNRTMTALTREQRVKALLAKPPGQRF